ncbi:hypothetical protein [Moorena sp. SIO4G3]|uniref:hypothetical protein n=1 Tax=Moorena sp. SIO4G3 TaxID=2607821 RepID=UPI00142CA326|nr:hypothetical protein [Moorena sp. SIO4G3]NEO79431.1 hypothetical protein [Moorena sp. SIO4G3]
MVHRIFPHSTTPLLPAPYSLLPTPCSLLPAPCSLFPVPYSQHLLQKFSKNVIMKDYLCYNKNTVDAKTFHGKSQPLIFPGSPAGSRAPVKEIPNILCRTLNAYIHGRSCAYCRKCSGWLFVVSGTALMRRVTCRLLNG